MAKAKPRNDELVNYLLRPAKNVERKMICEALSRLSIISDTRNYLYVGFGSVYYVDFTLFHKVLGIQNFISIEGDLEMETRVRFNNPYSSIEILSGHSNDKLVEVEWKKQKSILWLDYTSQLSGFMFKDIETFFRRAISGSVFIISINVEIKDGEGKTSSDRIKSKLWNDTDVKRRISPDFFSEKNVSKEEYYLMINKLINQEIDKILNQRNRIEEKKNYAFKQIFNFFYHDGQAMLTIGGILFTDSDKARVSKMNFKNLDFVRNGGDTYKIEVPHLTIREIQAIDKHLPSFNTDTKAKENALEELKDIVSEEAIIKYSKIYRYYPKFIETIV